MTTISDPSDIRRFQATVILRAVRLYIKTGIRANRAYTPSAMARTASNLTGKVLSHRNLPGVEAALEEFLGKEAEA
jgi:hypothetical protein